MFTELQGGGAQIIRQGRSRRSRPIICLSYSRVTRLMITRETDGDTRGRSNKHSHSLFYNIICNNSLTAQSYLIK